MLPVIKVATMDSDFARVAQQVERNLGKVKVASARLASGSIV